MIDANPKGEALLSDSFSFARPTLWCAQARLYEDRLELSGWRPWERYRRRIPLRCVLKVDAPSANRLLLWMADGQTIRLHLDNASQWQQTIAQQLED
jgi:hypothetical protein